MKGSLLYLKIVSIFTVCQWYLHVENAVFYCPMLLTPLRVKPA